MVYGIYKNIRDAAWQCLIDYSIDKLPVEIIKIANTAGIRILKNSDVSVLTGGESGLSLLDNGVWHLIYDDEAAAGRRRFTIAHELGHIFLGHELRDSSRGKTFTEAKPQSESESDMFAARLLAPACVLWGLDIHSAEDIARVCDISRTAANIRAERMAVLYERGKFLTSSLERRVFEQFKGFIKNKRE